MVDDKQLKSSAEEIEQTARAVGKAADRHPFRAGFIVGALATVAMTALIIQNGDQVKVEWFVLDLEWPLWIILLVSFVGGMVVWQFFLYELHRLHREASERRAAAGKAQRAARTIRKRGSRQR